ncbi:TrbL/VirB6 plasmid conjugal transfer protein [compost metagenome]
MKEEGYFKLSLGGQIFSHIDAALQGTLADGTARVMAGLAMLYGSLWTLQFTVKTLVWWWQGLGVAIQDIVMSTLKMAAVAACAFNIAWYISTVVPFVNHFPAWVGNNLMTADGTQMNAIDSLVSGFLNALLHVYESMDFSLSLSTLGGVGIILLMLFGGVPFITVSIGTLVVLKVSTLLLLVVGPIFIAFLLFDTTRHWFWSWVSTLGGFMLTQIFFSVVIAIELNLIDVMVIKDGKIQPDWIGAFSVLIVFSAFTFISVALPTIAASVMGGGAVPTTSAGGIMGRTLGAATGVSAAKKMAMFFAASRLMNRMKPA